MEPSPSPCIYSKPAARRRQRGIRNAGVRLDAGAGAGFGGCAVIFAAKRDFPAVRRGLAARFYSTTPVVDPDTQMIDAQPGPGALHMEKA